MTCTVLVVLLSRLSSGRRGGIGPVEVLAAQREGHDLALTALLLTYAVALHSALVRVPGNEHL